MWPCRHACRCVHFYPRPPRGGRPGAGRQSWLQGYFYPRPPRGGRRDESHAGMVWDEFLSTPSARRATSRRVAASDCKGISIHALREEGDADQISVYLSHDDFYPRPPRGGRPVHADTSTAGIYFYPRPPRGGRPLALQHTVPHKPISIHALREEGDVRRSHHSCRSRISIHALREEGDARCCRARSFLAGFLSTPSARRATCTSGRSYPDSAISIHALREEGDNCSSLAAAMTGRISIHALREEGDQNLT